MAATPDRLANVLEQYRDKLHQAGDNVHEEELDYIKEILASPIFNQYILGNPPSSENSTLIAEATNELITGIQDTKKDSPTHKRKVLLQRKESLKILRNAVTPKNVVLKRPHRVDATSALVQPPVLKLSLTPSHTGKSRTDAIDGLGPNHTPEVILLRQASLINGSSDDSIVASILNDVSMESSLNNSRMKNLSNSTSTLIDRTATNGGPMLKKKSSESFLRPGSDGSLSGSQPNISTLRSLPPMVVNSNHVSRPEPIGAALALDPSPRPTELYTHTPGLTREDGKKLVISPETRPPPPSYHAHMQKQLQHSQEPVTDSSHPLFHDVSETSLEGPHLNSPQQPPALTPPTHPMTNGSVTMDVSTAEKRKTTFTVRLDKGAEGLGFMVKAVNNEAKGEVGLSIQDLQAGGIAKRDGRLRRNDQISHINGHSLSTLPHSDAVSLLQSSRGPVELVVVREHPSHATPPSPPSLRHPQPTSPSRRHASSQSPAAHRHMTTKPTSGQPGTQSPPSPPHTPTPHPQTQQDIVNRDLNEVTGDEEWGSQQQQIVTIELPNDGRQGFGFGVVSVGESKKTVVHSLVPGGVAEQDGRLQREDQLLQINEESVLHMVYDDIITRLRTVYQAGRPIRLVIARTVSVETSTGEVPDINDSSDDDLDEFEVELHRGNNKGLGITIAGLVNTDTGEEVNGIYITSMNPNGAAAQAKRITVGDRILKVGDHSLKGLENMEAASVLRNSGNPVKLMLSRRRTKMAGNQPPSLPTIVDSSSEDPPRRQAWEVVDKWTSILGPDYVVKVDEVYKTEGGGLGIRMESTAELDEEGEPHSGSVHHVIQYIHPQGPVGRHGILRVSDEILEINGSVLVGLQHQEAIEVVKYTPNFVQVVVCRVSGRGEGVGSSPTNSPDGALSDSEEDKLLSNSDTLLALPSCDLSGLGDNFSRRLERKSWRVRHEQQKKLIKQGFEQTREEFLRHLREQDEELVAQEAELKERQRQAEEEERMKSDEDHNRDSALLFDYTSYRSSSQMSGLDESLQSPDSILDSDSSLLSPVPGSTLWEDELSEVILEKGNQGLGFSILDFADPLHSGEKVILIHSLVEGGAAEKDGGLRIGDKLLSVNNMSVLNHSLDFAVQQLVAVPLGGFVSVGVYHPLPGGPELESELCSPYSMDGPEEGDVPTLAFERASLGQEDEDQKPLSVEEEEPEGVATEAESESQDNPEEEGDDEKKKKPDTDDDEPPPPYSKDDPQDEKSDDAPHGDEAAPEATNAQQPKLNSGGPQEHVSEQPPQLARIETEITQTKLETHSADDIDSPDMDTPSPVSPASPISPTLLSRISSPKTRQRRSLSDLTRIKPEEGARLSQPLSTPVPQKISCTDSVNEFSHESLSSSDNTIVNSQSQPSQSELGPESNSSTITSGSLTHEYNTTPVYVSSPSSDRSQRSIKSSSDGQKVRSKEKITKRIKGKRLTSRGHKTNQTTNDSYPSTPTQENLTVNYSSPQGILCSSQESNFEGLSPELSDFGDHSSEVEPREIRIRKIGAGYGMNLAYDEKNSCVIVKSLSSSGAVGRDGRIRAGDRITAINGKSIAGFNLNKAKGILKRASTRNEELIIVYTPAPQVQGYIMPSGGSPYINTPGTRSSITEGIMPVQRSNYYPQGIQGAQGSIQLHPVMAPGPQYPPHGMMQNMYGAPAYHSPGVPPPPSINVPGGYFTQYEDQMSKPPPPPYVFPHQPGPSPAPPMMSQGPHPYPAQQPQTWNLNTPSTNGHIIQHSPIIGGSQWPGMSHSHMTPMPVLRDPPQYTDIHMMAMQQSQSQPPPTNVVGSTGMTQPYVRQPPPPQAAHFEHPPHLNQPSRPVVSPRPMNKSQSETRFRSGMPPRPRVERRHNTVSHAPQGVAFNGSNTRKKHRKIGDDVFEDKQPARRSKDEPMGPLSTHTFGKKEGKKDTLDTGRPAKYSRTHTLQESPEHSHHNSWAIEEEEDPAIRAEFPEADGHMFEVLLQKGKAGLGLSIVASTTQSLRGIVIMGIQQGGVAELSGHVKWGDMILKVNDTCVIGMSQQEVQELLAKAPPTVRFVLLRQHMVEGTQQQQKGKHIQADSDISLDGLAQVKAVTLYTDDKKSLGFNIEKGELVGGAPSVLISNISLGGPAEVSNSLQVGDQILSVDGQKILGYAYEKARLLLQQARQRGQVTVVVASHSSTTHKEGEGRGVELDKTRLQEGVVLRPKRRKSSLKQPSRRRPVSVDCDGKTGPKIGSPGILQKVGGAQVDSNRMSYYSNRSSQPMTEREVEQGFQYFEQKDKDITPLKECEIIIFMGTHDLGLVLTGGMDTPLLGIYIQHIVPDSPADRDGRLKPGDQIKMVNNTVMEELTRDEAMQTIKTSPPFVHLLVLRETSKSTSKLSLNEVDSVPSFAPADHPSNLELIELVKPSHGGLGLLICEQEDHPLSGVFVQNVVKNKAAYLDGRIHPGDKILAINGQDVSTARQDFVVHLLQSCGNKVSLEVLHPPHAFTPSPHPSHERMDERMEYGRSGDLDMTSGDPKSFQTFPPPPEYPYGATGRQPTSHDRIIPPYARVADSTPTSDYANEYIHHQYGGGYRGGGVANGDTDIDMPVSGPDEKYNVQVIHLHRGPSGLGFSIVGGKGSKHGDLPIYVKFVFEEGAAGQDGRLRLGDQILTVNGYSFESVTHEQAVETLKLLKGDIKLTVMRTE